MRVTTERLENCQVNVIIELDAPEIDEKLRQTARQISRKATVPGYRRGKAPFQAVIRAFGREVIQQQTIEDFGQELYETALKQVEYEPFQVGELQEVEWDPFRMKVLLPIRAEVDLGEYRSVRVPFELQPVTEEQVAEYLADLQQQNAQWVPVERSAAWGDQIVLDVQAAVDGRSILREENLELVLREGATSPLPGFHEQVVGMSAGEKREFVLTVPEDDADPGAAGQEAAVQVHLHTVKEQDLPPLDDELAMMIGDYDTLDSLKAGVRERLETEAQRAAETEYLDKVLNAFVQAATKIEYPPQAVDQEVDLAVDRMQNNLASSGIELDTFLRMIGKTRESYHLELRPAAEERLKKRLVLEKIAQLDKLQVEASEVDAELDRMRELFGPQAEDMMNRLGTPEGRLMVSGDLLSAKAQERAIQIAKGEAPPLASEDGAEASHPGTAVQPESDEAVQSGTETQVQATPLPEAGPETGVVPWVPEEVETSAQTEPQPEAAAHQEIDPSS